MVELLQSKDKHGLELCFVNILSRFEIKYASQLLNAKMLFAFEVAKLVKKGSYVKGSCLHTKCVT